MSTSTAYEASSYFTRGLDPEIARLYAQVEISWPREATLMRRLGVRPDMRIVELGSGPGFMTEKLLTFVPEGSVTAVELDSSLVAMAGARMKERGCERYSIVQADVRSTELAEGSFDVAFARYLFLHLPDPILAIREALRLLKPGGLLVTIDFDIMLGHTEPSFPEFTMLKDGAEKLLRLRGTDPRFGRRRQRRLLQEAGFCDVEADTVAVDSDELGSLEPFVQTAMDPEVVGRALAMLGMWSSDELDRYAAALNAFTSSPDPLIVQARPIAWGRKPNTSV